MGLTILWDVGVKKIKYGKVCAIWKKKIFPDYTDFSIYQRSSFWLTFLATTSGVRLYKV